MQHTVHTSICVTHCLQKCIHVHMSRQYTVNYFWTRLLRFGPLNVPLALPSGRRDLALTGETGDINLRNQSYGSSKMSLVGMRFVLQKKSVNTATFVRPACVCVCVCHGAEVFKGPQIRLQFCFSCFSHHS